MEVYYYCSYTGSPVGFILGKLNGVSEAEGTRTLSKDHLDPMIRKCFELGMVRKACGLLMQEPKRYFLLFKKLVARGGTDGLDYYLNIAFVTESHQQYLQWIDEDKLVTEDAIAKACNDTILVDRESDFGYKINSKSLATLTKKKFGSLLGKCRAAAIEDRLYFELSSPNADTDDVMKALGISDASQQLEQIPEGGNWVRLVKKKAKPNSFLIWVLILLAAMAICMLRK